MDNREAKFILSAYRPGGQDAGDPRFAGALEQVRRDPTLERWFRESIAFDAAVTEKFSTVSAPLGLRESILAGVKVSRASKFIPQSKLWAIAAAIVLAGIIALVSTRQFSQPQLSGWQTKALDVVSSLVTNQSKFDAESRDAGELVAWLRANHAPAAQKLSQNLEKLESLGCKTFYWNGEPVSVICFMRPGGGLIHLVAANASGPSNRARKSEPKFIQQGKWTTATWRDDATVYMLALEGSTDQLRSYLL